MNFVSSRLTKNKKLQVSSQTPGEKNKQKLKLNSNENTTNKVVLTDDFV